MAVRTLSIFNNQYITLSKDKSGSRMEYLDLIAGVMIINMILVHLEWFTETGFDVITKFLSFFMPWFFYKAGMFAKKEPIIQCIKKSFKRLIIPFLIYGIIGEIIIRLPELTAFDDNYLLTIWRITFNAFKSILISGTFVGNIPLWYLISLFIIKILFTASLNRDSYYLIGLLCLVAPILHFTNIEAPIYVANISHGMFYFAFGYLFRNIRINSLLLSFFLVILWVLIVLSCPNYIAFFNNELISGYYLGAYLCSLIGIAGLTSFIRLINIRIPILENIGRDSLGYFAMHFFIINSIHYAYPGDQSHCIECAVVTIGLMATLLPILVWICKKLPIRYLI